MPLDGGRFFLRGNAAHANLHDLPLADLDERGRARADPRQLSRFDADLVDASERRSGFSVYFNHSIHISKGVGCTTCHGPVGEMNITWRGESLYMRWCLQCHNAPENYLRPRGVFLTRFTGRRRTKFTLGERLMKEYKVQKLTNCTTCHR